eukprot:GDKJ01025578.1.p1 GENE.GDKJ01025578.1~~GDKJ01025578.1.p1  ORF type:complete len:288 (+),score=56.36 GDKJ01025578.1:37-864(+)
MNTERPTHHCHQCGGPTTLGLDGCCVTCHGGFVEEMRVENLGDHPLHRLLMSLMTGQASGIEIIQEPTSNTPAPNTSDKTTPACEGFIQNLQKVTIEEALHGKDDTGAECCICHIEYREEPHTSLSQTPCGHVYHTECISNWLKKCNSCPMCREEFETNQIKFLREHGREAEAAALEEEERQRNRPRSIRIPLSELFSFGGRRRDRQENGADDNHENDEEDLGENSSDDMSDSAEGQRRSSSTDEQGPQRINLMDLLMRAMGGGGSPSSSHSCCW